jgi:type IV pilus assembly protein PilM
MTREYGETIGKIFLSGGGARIPGMVEALGTRMNVETESVNPFERVPVQPDAAGGVNIEEAAPMLLLPLGLALRV